MPVKCLLRDLPLLADRSRLQPRWCTRDHALYLTVIDELWWDESQHPSPSAYATRRTSFAEFSFHLCHYSRTTGIESPIFARGLPYHHRIRRDPLDCPLAYAKILRELSFFHEDFPHSLHTNLSSPSHRLDAPPLSHVPTGFQSRTWKTGVRKCWNKAISHNTWNISNVNGTSGN